MYKNSVSQIDIPISHFRSLDLFFISLISQQKDIHKGKIIPYNNTIITISKIPQLNILFRYKKNPVKEKITNWKIVNSKLKRIKPITLPTFILVLKINSAEIHTILERIKKRLLIFK